jgi:crotonobetainyl-CoA:carnitine CoA-transferase CaiB-like acyl-CoA transferase
MRRANAAAMQLELAAVLSRREAADWEALLSAAGIPCGMVRDIGEAMTLPALAERGLTIPLKVASLPDQQDVSVLGPGFLLEQGGVNTLPAPPAHGEHTAEVKAWLAGPA